MKEYVSLSFPKHVRHTFLLTSSFITDGRLFARVHELVNRFRHLFLLLDPNFSSSYFAHDETRLTGMLLQAVAYPT
jgi:hypothetical protein